MTKLHRIKAAALAAMALTACGGSGVKPPDVKLNPNPKEQYEITLTIKDPPGPLQQVAGEVQFDIEGVYDDCMPFADRIAGVKPKSFYLVPITFRQKSGNTYVGHIYTDSLLDENYYGLGVCRWGMTGIEVSFTSANLERDIAIWESDIIAEKQISAFCPLDIPVLFDCATPLDTSEYIYSNKYFIAILQSRRTLP